MKSLNHLIFEHTTFFKGFSRVYVNRGHSRFYGKNEMADTQQSHSSMPSALQRNYAPLRLRKWSKSETSPSSVPTAQSSGIISNALFRRANNRALSWGEQISFFQTMKHKAS